MGYLTPTVICLCTACLVFDAAAFFHNENRAGQSASGILYVDDDAPPGGDGLTWQTAHRYLQDALTFASVPDHGITEIRIAQGIYKPDQGAGYTPGNRNHSFVVPSGIAMRGGYAGIAADERNGFEPDTRDWDKFESILSGDLMGNDPPVGTPPIQWDIALFSDNSRNVTKSINGEGNLFEGLVFSSGRGNIQQSGMPPDLGMGLFASGGSLEIAHCLFRGNSGRSDCFGSGASVRDATVVIRDSVFKHNRGVQGAAGLDVQGGNILVERCLFTENLLRDGTGAGAGAMVVGGVVRNCDFIQNRATQGASSGGLVTGAETLVENCRFIQNTADYYGGASGPMYVRCEFIGNTTNDSGAISPYGTRIDCVFRANRANDRGGVAYTFGASSGHGGPFIRCLFENNIAWNLSGGAFDGGVTGINCTFIGNDSWMWGGGAIHAKQNTILINCLLNGNKTLEQGGAIRVMAGKSLTVINTTIANNTSQQGLGGIAVEGTASLHNAILWGNQGAQATGSASISHSCIQGGWDGPGFGNISDDPMFADALGPDELPGTTDDDLRLRYGSPCIDAGDNNVVPFDQFDLDGDGNTTEPLPLDLYANRRFRNDPHMPNVGMPGLGLPLVDIGSHESQLPADILGDGVVGINDLLAVLSSWGPCLDAIDCSADVAPYPVADGVVNVQDLLAVIFSWWQ